MKKAIKKGFLAFSFIILSLIVLIIPFKVTAQDLCTKVDGIPNTPIYRAYFQYNGEHLFTYSKEEVDGLVANHGWTDEGVAWYAPRLGTPVYRLYNAAGSKDHLYTTDTNEVQVLCSTQGWTQDNGGSPIFNSGGNIPVYRVFHPLTGAHHLTTDENEYNILSNSGWNPEGVALYATDPNGTVEYPIGDVSIENAPGTYAVQADVSLSGSGSGYHSKIALITSTSAVSFGLQYDEAGMGGYKDATGFIVENVKSNDPGQQEYIRVNLGAKNATFRLMLALESDGRCHYYINGTEMGTVVNPNLKNVSVVPRVEGSARMNGDNVNADFSNIKLKNNNTYSENQYWKAMVHDTNPNVHSDISGFSANKHIKVSGTVTGLQDNEDWDSAYEQVSGIVDFYDQ